MHDSDNTENMRAFDEINKDAEDGLEQVYPVKEYRCELSWIIPNFEFFHKQRLVSERFSPKDTNYEWFLELDVGQDYDCSLDDSFYLGLSLTPAGNAFKKFGRASGTVEFSVTLKNRSSGKISGDKRFITKEDGSPIYVEKVIKRADLFEEEKKESIFRECNSELQIYCYVSFILMDDTKSICIEDFEEYISEEEEDFTINVDGNKKYNVHKCILAARSPVFEAMFVHDTLENQNDSIDIKDYKENLVFEMLRYIYTGKVKNLKAVAFELVLLAKKYNVEKLKFLCEMEIAEKLSYETCVETLIYSDHHNLQNLKNETIQYMKENLSGVIKTENWKNLLSYPKLLVDLLEAHATETTK